MRAFGVAAGALLSIPSILTIVHVLRCLKVRGRVSVQGNPPTSKFLLHRRRMKYLGVPDRTHLFQHT